MTCLGIKNCNILNLTLKYLVRSTVKWIYMLKTHHIASVKTLHTVKTSRINKIRLSRTIWLYWMDSVRSTNPKNWFKEYETRQYRNFSNVLSSRTIHRSFRGGITAGEGGVNIGINMNAYCPVKDAKQLQWYLDVFNSKTAMIFRRV